MCDLGIFPTMTLTSAQVRAFTDADREDLRDLWATDEMIGHLEALARESESRFLLDFAAQTITPTT